MAKLRSMAPRLGTMPPKVRAAPKTAESFYNSPEWNAIRRQLERERGRRCEERGCETPRYRVILDHIRERKDGGADLDPRNLRWLCFNHHQQKTATARAARARGSVG